ncbi:MAG: BatA domain-containing protein [Candidatus Firestonebacteria bacterium]
MGFIAFLNPLFLIGLAAMAIPILIHMLLRKYAKRIRFPSFKFLSKSDKITSQNRIKELILLAMRVLLMALIALAFARPYLVKNKLLQGDKVSAVIIIDNSYSMLYNNNLEKAKEKAMSILDTEIGIGNMCAILTLARPVAGMELIQDMGLIKNKIKQVEYDTTVTDFQKSVRQANQILSMSDSGKRKLFIITDMQKLGWEEFNFSEKLSAGVEVRISNLGQEDSENMAITGCSLPPVLLDDGDPVKLVARVENFSDKQKTVNVKHFIENREVRKESVTVNAYGFADVEFIALFGETIGTKGYIQIDDDKLMLDNKYYYSFRKRAALNVLIINGSPSAERNEDAAFFLKEALNPGEDPSSSIRVKVALAQNVETEELGKYDAVVVSNVKSLTRPAVNKMRKYLESWGRIIIGMGNNVDGTAYNDTFGDILPAELSSPKGDPKDRSRFLSILSVDYTNNMFMLFKNPKYAKSLETPRFYKYFQTFSTRNPILARYGNGDPLLIEKTYKDGKIMLFTSSFDRVWSDLPARAVFLPFIHEMLYYLTTSSDLIPDYRVHTPLIWHGRWKEMNVTNPGNETRKLEFVEGSAVYNDTLVSGFYKARIDKNDDYFSVNLQTKESDLTMDSEKAVLSNLTSLPNVKANTAEAKKSLDLAMKQQQEKQQKVWWTCLVIMFFLSLAELAFGNRIYV